MKSNRSKTILQYIQRNGHITVETLCGMCHISPETARRELNRLAGSGLVRRVYGGAVALSPRGNDVTPWDTRSVLNIDEKRLIAGELIKHIPDGATLALDSGTTLLELAKLLALKKELTVITNDLRIAAEICANTSHKVCFIGGFIQRNDLMMTAGYLATDFLVNCPGIDIAVLNADGFDIGSGIGDCNSDMAALKIALARGASKVYAAFDSSKFSLDAPFPVWAAKDIDLLITDTGIPLQTREEIRRLGCALVTVGGNRQRKG